MKVKIYKPVKNAMQSGKKANDYWLLEPIADKRSTYINPLTGWISSNDTNNQLRIRFNNKEEAIAYAESQGFEYIIQPEFSEKLKKKSYSSNFTAPLLD